MHDLDMKELGIHSGQWMRTDEHTRKRDKTKSIISLG